MIRKLVKLIQNYDKIMLVIENSEKPISVTKIEPAKKSKSYSLFNTPLDQREYIAEKQKGEK